MAKKLFVDKKKFSMRKVNSDKKEANHKEHSLECNTICSKDLDIHYKASKKLLKPSEWKMLKISWTGVINEDVLVRSKEIRNILKTIQHKKHRWLCMFYGTIEEKVMGNIPLQPARQTARSGCFVNTDALQACPDRLRQNNVLISNGLAVCRIILTDRLQVTGKVTRGRKRMEPLHNII